MEKKFYILFLFIGFSGLFRARAQDNTGCTAQFDVSYSGNQVYFRAADSITGTQQHWYFGDSTQLGFGNDVGVTHTYARPGSYMVGLVVRNSATGCHDSSSQVITISAPGPPIVVPPDTVITVPPDSSVTIPPDSVYRDSITNTPSDSLVNFLSSYPNPVSGQVHMDLKTDKAEMIYIRAGADGLGIRYPGHEPTFPEHIRLAIGRLLHTDTVRERDQAK
jgi:PKD domain